MYDKYVVLTGATGLLGSYLLKDLLLAGKPCAVLVRGGKFEKAFERVESLLARFEKENGTVLPRPVVLEGNLDAPMLGMDEGQRRWIREHCDSMLHNAASLLFQHEEKTGEPYRSNIEGTKNVLELCRETGIRQFHHVSTAYVCGLRTGLCREDELDVGQKPGNAYEESKIVSEKMVRSAEFLDSVTVYRPSIIIGDSKTGYTSTYHGFYTPLKIVHSFVRSEVVDGTPLLGVLGLSGSERKYFVPVDWVSAAATRIFTNAKLHGNVYHLVPKQPTTCKTTLRVFEDALRRRRKQQDASETVSTGPETSLSEFNAGMINEIFRDQMEVYRAYWRDDPIFDRTNIERALPDLPCPNVNYAMLIRLAMYALESGFGWPKPQTIRPKNWARNFIPHCEDFLDAAPSTQVEAKRIFGLQLNGSGGGNWTGEYEPGGKLVVMKPGLPIGDAPLVYMNTDTFYRIVCGKTPLTQALRHGAVHIENPPSSDTGLWESLFQNFTHSMGTQ